MKLFYQIWLAFLSVMPVFSQGYYPLQIGNVWQYRDSYALTYGFTTKAIKDTIMLNGFSYVVLFSDQELDTLYFRQSGSEVHNYSTRFQHDELWYDFSKNIGDTIAVLEQPFDTSDVIFTGYQTAIFFGKTLPQWEFYEKWRLRSLYAIRTITDSLGLTSYRYEAGMAFNLVGAIINGITYGTITQVENKFPSIPHEYILYQNYPNPFNPSTIIAFKVPQGDRITLTVYNLLGEQIRILYSGIGNGDVQKILWNGKDDIGIRVSSGVYLYHIRSGTFSATKKLLLVQ